jgi:N-acetylglucosaminyl-diphospho-decaprenol L-rhamnosyltransferase
MSLTIVIVNYRSADLVIDCLASLAPQIDETPDAQVIVTDNLSGDGSVERLRSAISKHGWSRWATLTPLPTNGGFAAGNNAAIRPLFETPGGEPPRYVLLLNPDTVVRPSGVAQLVGFMDAHPEVGIAGSQLEYPDGEQQASRFRFPTILGEVESNSRLRLVSRLFAKCAVAPPLVSHPHSIDWVAGASMIVRREVFEAIGYLDEEYFLYYEEVDFCLRARRAGWPCWYVPESRVVHLVGQSSGVTNLREPPRRRPRYWFESRRRYFVKNHGRAYAFLADVAYALSFGAWRVRRALQGKPDTDPPRMWSDFVQFSFLGAYKP